MPLINGHDVIGKYYKFGKNGKRYYYHNKQTQELACKKALRQGKAIQISKNRHFLF